MKSIKIGIIGNGFVGQATRLFECEKVNVLVFDVDASKCVPPNTSLEDLTDKCDVIFVCVPTPMNKDGSCYTGIVENVVSDINKSCNRSTLRSCCKKPFIVVRSTVPPETCKRLNVYHMPEFLTEKNWKNDFKTTEKWIVGLMDTEKFLKQNGQFIDTMNSLFHFAHESGVIDSKNIVFVNSTESELIKYTRNAFLAVKVSYCNEIARYCEKINISYNVIREHFPDYRITNFHTSVPGYDGHNGYGGTCLPKDTQALAIEMRKRECEPLLIEASIKRNNTIDRPEKDWNENKGRSVIE